ncbi:MAG TPA: alpha/beta hydrolase [Steroidobacteraceae bacterium]|jgi:acetyl esterase/lipase|nr:alpha/beta hydrolase [Steroidobacteraceae bacterium]
MSSAILAAGFALLAGVPAANSAGMPVTADVAGLTTRTDVFPRASVTFPDGVIAFPDVEYANLNGFRPLLLDIYRQAAQGKRPRPLVIYVHGGGWRHGDSRTTGAFTNFPRVLASLAARGYVVASIDYRLTGEARYPAAVQDVNSAIAYLRLHADEWGIDPARIVLWGASAGGYLVAMSATTCHDPHFGPLLSTGRMSRRQAAAASAPKVSDCVQAVVSWYGLFDLGPLAAGTGSNPAMTAVVRNFLGCRAGSCLGRARRASPLSGVSPRTPPMLLMAGTADTEVPCGQTLAMAAALRREHVPMEMHLIKGANHGWIAQDPAATRRASLEALRRTFQFIDRVTKRPS